MSDAESIVLSGSAISISVGVSVAVAVGETVGETVAVGKESHTGIVADVISPSLHYEIIYPSQPVDLLLVVILLFLFPSPSLFPSLFVFMIQTLQDLGLGLMIYHQ